MAILNRKYLYIFCIGVFIFFGQACSTRKGGYSILHIDSTILSMNAKQIYNDYEPVYSFHYLFFKNKTYIACLKNDTTVVLKNVFEDGSEHLLFVPGKIHSIGSRDSSLVILYNLNALKIITFHKDDDLTEFNSLIKMVPPVFNDTLFVYVGTGTCIQCIDSNQLLIPYGQINNTLNYLDTDAYMYTSINKTDTVVTHPMIKTPVEYLSGYEYYTASITDYNAHNNCLYYTFNKRNYLYRLNIAGGKLDSVEITSFKTTPFPGDKMRNLSYVRKYVYLNDKNTKIVTDSNYIYLIVRNHDKTYDIRLFSEQLTPLGRTTTNKDLFPEMAFMKNHTLYVPAQKNTAVCFSPTGELPKAH